ncbi:MAG: ribonuclease III [Candidatus Harrisonbacteria bacterium RIFCSPHIGHO2_01_FULL_44_13]|uniref:Ribonuclease 3 n=1 Tax=Candidatus Harrisonbacteria bacterium RIFCSPLOWO2_01_FULL_44_18 TaxID=1798407 RepID=A0A1G1ZN09_9BACT|nr:MAG: ribonuclease III [Candidatus Harrisonbacteria bacterium RIFCSPHIGHO2_01_FULL_44_13]OGY65217.1 MAG: ribonuclease III [Candidatus Harrisonbacteria bacterium RIFCSPLOWO2_01_FULL_44_18]
MLNLVDLSKLEKTIEYGFKDKDLLKEALTHRSYLNENPSWGLPHNERLEFLGDAVLELAVTEELFNRFPDAPEGSLTSFRAALVNYQMLANIARNLNLEKFILLSRGEAKDTGRARDVILANAIEALIGAVYLDAGYEPIKKFVSQFIMIRLDEVLKFGLYKDAKSLLQEKVQADLKLTPNYKVLSEKGPDHAKIFTVGVYFGEKFIVSGEGASKQDAEVEAAKKALETL